MMVYFIALLIAIYVPNKPWIKKTRASINQEGLKVLRIQARLA